MQNLLPLRRYPSRLTTKVILLGDSAVGKTEIIRRASESCFVDSYIATVGIDFRILESTRPTGEHTTIQLWDTAGATRYRSSITAYILGCAVAALMYSVDDAKSFDNISHHFDLVTEHSAGTNVILVATKCDLRHQNDDGTQVMVSTEQGLAKARQMKAGFVEVSAKTGQNVDELIAKIMEAGDDFFFSNFNKN